MKRFIAELKQHPGVGYACMFTLMGFVAGASRKSAPTDLLGGLMGALIMGGVCWGIVLTTAWQQSRLRNESISEQSK